jgi:hypothetical protein
MPGVTDDILNLRFASGPIESMYLNIDRVNERFTSHLGAISRWSQSAGTETGGALDVKVVKADRRASGSNELIYDLHDPLARALVLRTALQGSGDITSPDHASVGQYVIASGTACLTSPQLFLPHPTCVSETDPVLIELERERAVAEALRLALAGPASTNDRMWLLTLANDQQIVAASVLNSLWISDSATSYWHFRWDMFGNLRQHTHGIPVIAAIHVWVHMD